MRILHDVKSCTKIKCLSLEVLFVLYVILVPVVRPYALINMVYYIYSGRRGRDRMVVGFTATYAISAYYYTCSELKYRSGRGGQHYVIKFVSDLRHVGGFLRVLRFPPLIKLTTTI